MESTPFFPGSSQVVPGAPPSLNNYGSQPQTFVMNRQTADDEISEAQMQALMASSRIGFTPAPNPSLIGNSRGFGLNQDSSSMPWLGNGEEGRKDESREMSTSTMLSNKGYTINKYDQFGTRKTGASSEKDKTLSLNRKDKQALVSQIKRKSDTLPTFVSEYIIIGIMSEYIKQKISVVNISKSGTSGQLTINDPQMGIVPGNNICATCRLDISSCPGHFGRILFNPTKLLADNGKTVLEKSYIHHPFFIRETEHVLSCVCADCGSLKMNADNIESANIDHFEGYERLRAMSDYCRKKGKELKCPGTNARKYNAQMFSEASGQPSYVAPVTACRPSPIFDTKKESFEKGKLQIKTMGGDEKMIYDINEVYSILDKISDEDKKLMGFDTDTHPRDLILQSILVIPPAYREASTSIPGAFNTDKFGDTYNQIVKANLKLLDPELAGKKDDILGEIYKKYSALLTSEINNEAGKKSQLTGLLTKLRKKEGILRNVALGKRIDYTGRSVIGPNPYLTINQVGIPRLWQSKLTVPIKVTRFNRKGINKLMEDGRITSIIRGRGKTKGYRQIITDDNRASTRIYIGDTCERWLQEGDFVTLNRQPSIHKQNIMGMEVVFVDALNIQLNPSYTSPFNADFDGDEMNIHMPQTHEARAELETVMALKNCLMNEQMNAPMIGLIMSDVTGSFILTNFNQNIDQGTWYACQSLLKERKQLPSLRIRLHEEGISMFSEKALFSMTLPETLNYTKGGLVINNGVIKSGVLTKGHIGKSKNSIFQAVANDFGYERTTKLLDDTSKVLNRWFTSYGFSIGLESCTHTDPKVMELKEEKFAQMKILGRQYGIKMEDPIEDERRKRTFVAKLDNLNNMMMKTVDQTRTKYNELAMMIIPGSKGSVFNETQIKAMLGPQKVGGEPIPHSMTNQSRPLPTYEPNDPSPSSIGFIEHSFSEGLTPSEVYFHAAGSREGLIDTALKTAQVGKIGRDLQMSLGDYRVEYDGSVRNSHGEILQFTYGDDGFNPGKLESVKMNGEDLPFFINLTRSIKRLNQIHRYTPFQEYKVPSYILEGMKVPETIYKAPSFGAQIQLLIENDARTSLLSLMNNYVKDDNTNKEILDEYTDDSTFYLNISDKYKEDNNEMKAEEERNFINKYIEYLNKDNKEEFGNDEDPEQKYLDLSLSSMTDTFGLTLGYEDDNIYGSGYQEDFDRITVNEDNANYRMNSDDGELPFSDKMFKLITAFDFFNHRSSLSQSVKEIHRVLEDGGYLLISDYEKENDIDRLLIDVDHMIETSISNLPEDKFKEYRDNYVGEYRSRIEMERFLQSNGFERIDDGIDDEELKMYYAVYRKI